MDLMQLIQSQLGQGIMQQLAGQANANPQQTSIATNDIIQTLIGALANNASNEKGASSLFNALEKDHDGSLLNHLDQFVNPNQPNPLNERTTNGLGILNHLLGDKAGIISQLIGQRSGMSQEGILGLMSKLAPIVMAVLGNQKNQQGGFGIQDLMGLLTNQKQQIRHQHIERRQQPQQKKEGSLLDMLDFDGDGSGLDDAMGFLGKLFR